MCSASVFRIQVYLPEKFFVLFPNQNNIFHGLTGSATVVYYPLKNHSVLLKSNRLECSSVDYYHTFSSYIAAKGHSGFNHKGHDSPRDRDYPRGPPPLTQPHIFWSRKVPFPSHSYIYRDQMLLQIHTHTFSEHHNKRQTLVTVTGAKKPSNLMLSSDHPGIQRSLESIPKSQCTQCYTST